MLATNRNGFTLLEVTVAAFLLTAGIGALVGTAAGITRLVVRGRQTARTTQAAMGQFELLRGLAAAGPGGCASLSDGVDSTGDGTVWSWRITPSGGRLEVSLAISAPVPEGRSIDTLTTALRCP